MNTQDLIALAKKHGALVLPRLTGEFVTFAESEFVTFCAALSAAQPKADERGSAEPIGQVYAVPSPTASCPDAIAIVMGSHPDSSISAKSAQARDAARWEEVARRYDSGKTSACQNILDGLLIDADPAQPFASIIDAQRSGRGKEQP